MLGDLDTFYDLYVYSYLLAQIWWDEAPWGTRLSSIASPHWCGAWVDNFWGESAFRAVGKEAIRRYHGPHDPRVTMKILIQWCLTWQNPCPKIWTRNKSFVLCTLSIEYYQFQTVDSKYCSLHAPSTHMSRLTLTTEFIHLLLYMWLKQLCQGQTSITQAVTHPLSNKAKPCWNRRSPTWHSTLRALTAPPEQNKFPHFLKVVCIVI